MLYLLEAKSRPETPLARLIWSIKPRDKSEVTVVGVTSGVREVRVVRRVQRLGSELELHLFRDRERSEDTQIRLEESRTTQIVSTPGSEAGASFVRPGTV